MSTYYYFGATLPGLRFESPPSMSYAEFMARAARFVSARDLKVLEAARLYVPEDGLMPAAAGRCALLCEYYAWETALRNELVKLRAQKLAKPAEAYLRPGAPELEAQKAASAAFQAEDPLQGELVIERERWAYIETLAVNRLFDLDFLCAYALLLQSLERRGIFKADIGEEGYKTVYQSVLDAADYRDESGESK